MEMANTKKKPECGDRMHNGRSDKYKKIGKYLAGRQWKYGIFVLILDFLKNSEKLRR